MISIVCYINWTQNYFRFDHMNKWISCSRSKCVFCHFSDLFILRYYNIFLIDRAFVIDSLFGLRYKIISSLCAWKLPVILHYPLFFHPYLILWLDFSSLLLCFVLWIKYRRACVPLLRVVVLPGLFLGDSWAAGEEEGRAPARPAPRRGSGRRPHSSTRYYQYWLTDAGWLMCLLVQLCI